MNEEDPMVEPVHEHRGKYEVDIFAEHDIEEFEDTPTPAFLKWLYVLIPIWGIVWFIFYWNGSQGTLDRGAWQGLEKAAKTTFVGDEEK